MVFVNVYRKMKRIIFFAAILLLFFILLGAGYLAVFKNLDPDFGWHLRTGQLILERGVPKTDWYSFTMQDFPWIDHEWLTDILIYKGYSTFGFFALLILFLVLTAFAFIIPIRLKNFSCFIFPVLIGYFASLGFLGLRPQIITILFIAILGKFLSGFLKSRKFSTQAPRGVRGTRLIFCLPILFLAWANLHAGFFAGLFILFLFLILEIFKKTFLFKKLIGLPFFQGQNYEEQSIKKILVLFIVLISSFLVTLVNPYGIRIYEEVFRTIGDAHLRFHIAEWLPLFFTDKIPIFAIIYISFFFGLLIPQYKKIEFNNLVLLLLFFIFSLLSQRHFPIFIILTIPIFAQLIFYFKKEIVKDKLRLLLTRFNRWLITFVLTFLIIFVFGSYPFGDFLTFISKEKIPLFYPQQALPFLKTLPLSENLLNEYNWGGYLIWQIPERKLFIDGRMPSWRKDGQFVFGDYVKIMEAKERFQDLLEKYDIKIILLNKEKKEEAQKFKEQRVKTKNKFQQFFEKHNLLAKFFGIQFPEKNIYNELINLGWQVIYQDETAVILKR